MSQRRHALIAIAAWAVLSIIGILLVIGLEFLPVASDEARIENHAFVVLTAVSVPVLMFVVVGMVYTAISFRSKDGADDAPAQHGHGALQVGWVVVTTLMVVGLFAYGAFGLVEIRGAQEATFEVQVHGKQWEWSFDYPAARKTSKELYLPVDQRVHLVITSNDAIHSLWIQALGVKQDAVPGRPTEAWVTPTVEGTYSVQCAELCGFGHTIMVTDATVATQAELDAWLADQEPMKEEPPPS
jgi:cytochrome c oxidase subunit II